MRLLNVKTFKLEEFYDDSVPPYAILSHTWGKDSEEVSFRDVEEGNIEKTGTRPIKLDGCCKRAITDGLWYVWIDTCCIDKANSVELGEAINSMFKWYMRASICYTYLSDVPADDNPRDPKSKFYSSRWFTRGWTLQELLAPRKLRFYNVEWGFLGTKSEMSVMIEKITGIPRPFLLDIVELREASVAQRMSWAAKRVTKRKEDIAYCLLGIFGVMMPMIYGEGSKAFSRLQEEIMKEARDDSILAWGLDLTKPTPSQQTDVISGGILAASPLDFVNCGQIVSHEQYTTSENSYHIFAGSLRIHLPLFTTSGGETFGLLKCGVGHNTEQVVGIPLDTAMSKGPSDEYIRPQGRHPVLFPKATSETSNKLIHIRKERQRKVPVAMNRRYWFYIEESAETDLELIDVEPRDRWQKDKGMIATMTESDYTLQRTSTRFRHKNTGFPDFVVVLDFEIQKSQRQAQCHVMIVSRETTLERVTQNFLYMRQDAFGKQSASNGLLNLCVSLRQESIAAQPMFVIRLAATPTPPKVTVDATLELAQLDVTLELVKLMIEEEEICQETKELEQYSDEKMALFKTTKEELQTVEEEIRKLSKKRDDFLKIVSEESIEIDQLNLRRNHLADREYNLSRQRLHTQQHLHLLLDNDYDDATEAPKDWYEVIQRQLSTTAFGAELAANDRKTLQFWAAANGLVEVVKLLLEKRTHLDLKDKTGRTALSWAAGKGKDVVVKLLLNTGNVDRDSNDTSYRTPLSWAAGEGQEGIVKLLIDTGTVKVDSKDIGNRTPLSWAAEKGHEAVVKLLLDTGLVEADSKDIGDRTPLSWAAEKGQEAVVKLLLDTGMVEADSKDMHGRTPLLWAAEQGREAVVNLLLDTDKAKVDSKSKNGNTPLWSAATCGYKAVVQLLLERGAEVDSKGVGDFTPLSWAARTGKEAVVQLLLEKGAEVDSRSKDGSTPLSNAARGGSEAVVRLLLAKGADLEAKDNKGYTPLMWAAKTGQEAVARWLIARRAKLEAEDRDGRTPLSWAAGEGEVAMVRLLLVKGADFDSNDRNGHTPLWWAREENRKEIVAIISSHLGF